MSSSLSPVRAALPASVPPSPARIALGAVGVLVLQLLLVLLAAVLETTPGDGGIDFGLTGFLVLLWLYGGWAVHGVLVGAPLVVASLARRHPRTSWWAAAAGLGAATLLQLALVVLVAVESGPYVAVSPPSYAVALGMASVIPALAAGLLWRRLMLSRPTRRGAGG